MPALNFHKQFAPAVRASIDSVFQKRTKLNPKGTSIRSMRKRSFKKGDKLYLYTGMRTQFCHKIGEAECTKVEDCAMYLRDDVAEFVLELDGTPQSDAQIRKIAKLDGFDEPYDFFRWFETTHGFPFQGQRIHWTTSYKRKYYLHYKVKLSGFEIKLDKTSRTILVPDHLSGEAASNQYINELKNLHNYGVQLTQQL